ncbi:receptor-type tyrosine-protein phosphatase T-like isoform X4 [Zophobas morio]|uniref:receptor-type tyrosine-protein phosphatase T-like isoform X4 n=2 Tax=Zophobas morio TaxID=2755281 RepID=UPI0030839B8B
MLCYFKVIFCGLVVFYMTLSICQSSYFLAKQYENDNYICVTNSSSALSWIQEDIQEKFDYVTTYIPEQPPGEMNCNITDDYKTKNHFTKHPWKLRHSMQSEINYPILDERWEAMEVIKTEYVEPNYYKLKYELIKNVVPKESFNVPLSIRIENEAHIFLCDGEDPPKARCYWFMLQAFSGTGSAIRKCEKGYINSEHGTWPMAPCKEAKVYINHNIVPTYLSSKKWSHFVLSKQKNILKFTQISDHKENQIMEWRDDKSPIDVKNVIVHSKRNNGLWKIHNVDFLYTDVVSSDVNLGPLIYSTNRFICISMYVTMCSSCKLILSLAYGKHIITSKEFENKHAGWTQIKFMAENAHSTNGIKLLVSTKSSDPKPFWAIDKVRLCRKKEFRVMVLTEEAPCQLISESEQIAYFKRYSQVNVNSNCPEDAIGDFCVPYNWIFEECKQITICKGQKCVCSAGYQGKDCYYECDKNTYGHGCQKQCGKCYYYYKVGYSCDHVHGKCPSSYCEESYSGPKCDIPPATIFAKPPQIIEISYTEATVRVSNFQLENSKSSATPLYYIVQYKTAEASDISWRQMDDQYTQFNLPAKFKISNLTSETQYLVRSVIISTDGRFHNGDHLKTNNFTTKCDDISDNDINIEASNTTARIYLSPGTSVTCKSYTITLFEQQAAGFLNNSGTFFADLMPYESYTVKVCGIQKTLEKKFTTTEGVPTSVLTFTATAASATTANLTWTEPSSMNGGFKHYVVEYQHISYVGCNFPSAEPPTKSRRETTDTSITITELIPYSLYNFSVFAVNTKFNGPPVSQTTITPSSETIQPKETPTIVDINTTHVSANIVLSKIKCEDIRGPLTVEMKTTCTSEWCQGKSREPRTDQKTFPNEAILGVMQLEPFSEYDLELKFCRGTESCSVPQKKKFKTMTSVPRVVTDLLVYTKNASSVSLRWKPPYPPTGILKDYTINYSSYRKKINQETVVPITPCTLWSELHCATLSDLPFDAYLTFKIYARNQDPDGYGPSKEVQTFVRIDKSKSPYDLVLNWTSQNHLQVEWKHPNQTNGDVSYFGIQILSSTGRQNAVINEQKLDVSRETYNLTYQYVVNGSALFPTTSYKVAVFAFNGESGDTTEGTTTSPPDVPTLSESEPEFVSSNDSFKISVSPNEVRGSTDTYRLFVLKSDKQTNLEQYPNLQEYDLKNLKVVVECNISQISEKLEINIGSLPQNPGCTNKDNSPLQPATNYNITIVLQNVFKNESRARIYRFYQTTLGEPIPPEVDPSLYALLILLLIIPLLAFLYIKRNKLTSLKDSLLKQDNTSTEVLESKDDQIPLAQVTQPNISISVPKKVVKTPVKPPEDTNPTSKIYSKPIKITDFEQYVKDSIKNGELERQHAYFPRGQTKPWKYGSMKENKSKNRYNNLIAYDHSRVILETMDGQPNSDYINASYINGYKVLKAYIATQGPKVATLNDFWRMMWQENVKHIANLANIYESGKKKLEKYWPDINETLQFGDITVQHVSRDVYADYEHRTFAVTYKDECRKIEQLHFSSWPDHGVPLYSQSLVPFLQKMLQIPLNSKSPVVVHCSAGVGRTGTILLCDICLRMAAREGTIDVLRNLQLLRDQRANMVDNIEQYKLAHLVVLECLVGLHTSIQCSEIDEAVQKVLSNGSLVLQMRYLQDTQWQDQAMKTVGQAGQEVLVVREKNRFENIIPEIQGRVFITRYPATDESSSYINAVKVDGFRSPGRFIVTQQPLPNTLGDFWRLVDENSNSSYSVIVSLNEINPRDTTSCDFWPTTTNPQMKPIPPIILRHQNTLCSEYYDVITIHLHSESRKDFLPVQVLSMKNWPPRVNSPTSVEEFLTFMEQADSTSRGTTPIFVTCYDGVKASGLYVAMSFIIEKMKLEQMCDVCQAVRTIRHNRQQFVQDLEQFEFLYKAAVLYINGFESYANFN